MASPGFSSLFAGESLPFDDITRPAPDLTGYTPEGQIVLSGELAAARILPPVAALLSFSRRMKGGIGEGTTCENHAHIASQPNASYATTQGRGLAVLIGAEQCRLSMPCAASWSSSARPKSA